MIEVENLRKAYGPVNAVDGVSFCVEEGEIFGLLGPNGAGKTTTLSCMACLLDPDDGEILVGGRSVRREPDAVKALLGAVPQEIALYEELTVAENLRIFGSLYGLRGRALQERAAWALGFALLEEFAGRRCGELSGGMKRRLNMAAALLHEPAVVLADEPTVGVDPQSRNHIFDCIRALAGTGKTVVYTTHYMEEVERLCGRAAIIDHGRIIAVDTIDGLLDLAANSHRLRLRLSAAPNSLEEGLRETFRLRDLRHEGDSWRLAFPGPIPVAKVATWLEGQGVRITDIATERPTLEDVFLKLTGRRLRDQ